MASFQAADSRRTVRSIQVLRAVAAIVVVYYHAVDAGGIFGLPSTGAWGVDVFFVISGFIIGTVTGRGTHGFFRRRVLRVVPLYWIATFCWIAALIAIPTRVVSTQVDLPGVLKSLFFVPYLMPRREGPIFYLGWTLNYEMFFYAVVAVLLILLRNSRRALVCTAILLTALVVSGIWFPSSNFTLLFYQGPLLLEFIAGLLIAFAFTRFSVAGGMSLIGDPLRASGRAAHRTVYVGASLLAAVALVTLVAQDLLWGPRFDEMRVVAYGIPACALVIAGLLLEPLIRDGRLTRGLLVVGDSSYALYLFHQFVLLGVSQLLLRDLITTASVPLRVVMLLATMAVAVAAGILIDRWIDRPLRRSLSRLVLPRRESDEDARQMASAQPDVVNSRQ